MIFIVGVGRSGTSLLQSILSGNNNIYMLPETGFLRKAVLGCQSNSNVDISELYESYPRLTRIPKDLINKLPNNIVNNLEFYKSLIHVIYNKNKAIVGADKDPKLVEYMPGLNQILPNSKVIHLIRDPRDVLLSKKNAEWSKGWPSWYHIFANYIQLKIGHERGVMISGKNYYEFTYESLLSCPEQTIKEVCKFLDVGFDESMLSFQSNAKELVAEDELQWKKETMGPLLKNNMGKWKGNLSNWEVALTEKMCKQAFKIGNYKYSNSFQELSILRKIYLNGLVVVFKAIGVIYSLFRFWSQKLIIKWKY